MVDSTEYAQSTDSPLNDSNLPEVEAPEPKEQMLSKDVVSEIVKREREKAFRKGQEAKMMELQEQMQQQAQAAPQAQQAQQGQVSMGGMQQFSPDDIKRIMAEEMPRHIEEHVNQAKQQQMIQGFVSKMQAAEEKHPGLEADLNKMNFGDPATSAIVLMANDMPNTGDIMRELLDHPHKFSELLVLVNSQPHLAAKAMHSLSNSISQNEKAKAENKEASKPVNHIKPSVNAGMDSGDLSVTDFRKMFS